MQEGVLYGSTACVWSTATHCACSDHPIPPASTTRRPPDPRSCRTRRSTSLHCSNTAPTLQNEGLPRPGCLRSKGTRRARRAQERSPEGCCRRLRCRSIEPMPSHEPMHARMQMQRTPSFRVHGRKDRCTHERANMHPATATAARHLRPAMLSSSRSGAAPPARWARSPRFALAGLHHDVTTIHGCVHT